MDAAAFRDLLRKRGSRATSQRLVLFEVLAELRRHTTADEVMERASARLPALSLPTVYATLELFEQLGVVRRVSSGTGPALFDPVLDGHAHLACRQCGRLVDLPVKVDLRPAVGAATRRGHSPAGAEVIVAGVCADCGASDA